MKNTWIIIMFVTYEAMSQFILITEEAYLM